MSFTTADVAWLAGHPDAVAAAGRLELSASSQLADLTRLRGIVGAACGGGAGGADGADSADGADGGGDRASLTRALAELVTARRGAARGRKIPDGPDGTPRQDWMVCTDSAQQATPVSVGQVRMRHLVDTASGASVADVTCSVGTELAVLSAAGAFRAVVGADIDPARLAMARHNLPEVPLVRADAVAPALRCDVVVADPARRTSRGRIRDPRDLVPPLPDLVDAWRSSGAELAVKCAPGIDYSDWEGQVDIVGVSGGGGGVHGAPGVKEACLYTPGLARYARRAVVIGPEVTAEVTSAEPESDAVAPVGRYILDPDGAVVRAGLVRQYAARLGWWRIDPHIAYLSGDDLDGAVSSALLPGQRVFEVLDTVPVKRLKAALTAHGCGSLEVLVRGVDVDPDMLRRKMRSGGAIRGSAALTVVVARVGRSPVAVVARVAEIRS